MILRILLSVPFLLSGLVLLAAPLLGPRELFFAVRVPPGFRSTAAAKQALRLYEAAVASVVVIATVWLVVRQEDAGAFVLGNVLLFVVAMGIWLRNYRVLKPYRANAPTTATVDLTTEPDRLPRYFGAMTVPPAILAATALYLHAHWSSIPARFAIHWGEDGQPNGWETRTVRGVYGPLIFAGLWMVWMAGMAFASWYGAQRSPMRTAVAKIMIAVEFLFGIVWPTVALLPLYKANDVLPAAVIVASVAGMIIFSIVALRKAGSATGGVAAGGYAGSCFFDRRNSALLLPRADGLGYCPNFAHPLAWVLMLYPFLLVFVAIKFIF